MTSTSDRRDPPPQLRHYAPTYPRSTSFRSCCCCLFLLVIFLALLAVAVALVLVLAVKPKKPDFELRRVGVSYLLVTLPPSASPPAAADAYLTMNISLLFLAGNPNKVGIRYESPGFDLMYKGVPLGSATLPSFEVPAHGSRLVETRVAVSRVDVLQSDAVQLVRDASVYDRVEFRVLGDVGARIRVLSFTSPKVQVSVDCAVVVSPSKQAVTSTQCGVVGVNV